MKFISLIMILALFRFSSARAENLNCLPVTNSGGYTQYTCKSDKRDFNEKAIEDDEEPSVSAQAQAETPSNKTNSDALTAIPNGMSTRDAGPQIGLIFIKDIAPEGSNYRLLGRQLSEREALSYDQGDKRGAQYCIFSTRGNFKKSGEFIKLKSVNQGTVGKHIGSFEGTIYEFDDGSILKAPVGLDASINDSAYNCLGALAEFRSLGPINTPDWVFQDSLDIGDQMKTFISRAKKSMQESNCPVFKKDQLELRKRGLLSDLKKIVEIAQVERTKNPKFAPDFMEAFKSKIQNTSFAQSLNKASCNDTVYGFRNDCRIILGPLTFEEGKWRSEVNISFDKTGALNSAAASLVHGRDRKFYISSASKEIELDILESSRLGKTIAMPKRNAIEISSNGHYFTMFERSYGNKQRFSECGVCRNPIGCE